MEFDLALDELRIVNGEGRERYQRIIGQPNVAELQRSAEALSRKENAAVDFVLYRKGEQRNESNRRVLTRRVMVQVAPGTNADALAAAYNAKTGKELSYAPGFFIFHTGAIDGALSLAAALRQEPSVLQAEPILERMRNKRLIPNDPYFQEQWHLRNTGQNGATAGIDINVTNVWNTFRGSNVVVAIVDDGLQYNHPDLAANADTVIDYDYRDGDSDPLPVMTASADDDSHGSAVAGIVAARANNSLGVAGIAYESKLVGVRLIGAAVGDDDEAAALSHSNQVVHVSNNSWGPADDGYTKGGAGTLALQALQNNTLNGRGGKGTIYLWAGGNGGDGDALDNVNYDTYANSMYTIAVGALNDLGRRAHYSEPGACLVISAPSGGATNRPQAITTTDLTGESGYNYAGISDDFTSRDYTRWFNGTSAATPVVSGCVALLLQSNPNLGWRDVQEILMASAKKNDPLNAGWFINGSGRFRFHHEYGAGLIDVDAAIQLARNWKNLPARTSATSTQRLLSIPIPDNNATGVTLNFDLTNTALRVEHVTVTVTITHPYRGDLDVTLISPRGTSSRLAEEHFDNGDNYSAYKFMSVFNWGEISTGTWKVKIADRASTDVGTINSVEVQVFGTVRHQPVLTAQPTNGCIRLMVDGHAGRTNVVQASANLASWSTVLSTNHLNGLYEFMHCPPAQQTQFYRVLVP